MEAPGRARAFALGRIAIGAGLLVVPGLIGGLWIGSDAASGRGARVLLRALGARDLALGFGLKAALDRDAPTRGWLEAGLVADGADFAATVTAGEDLPLAGRVLVGAMAASGLALGAWLVRSVEREPAGLGSEAAGAGALETP